ncbi:class I SAM-dependent methyltransferase [Solihabitans fulvus]|uniref:Class I SAM-dependent methyltransferase n=1 Tax=Solihabitans fulvus TaxID=1892852 RepID=A0A5B2WRR6_9PSEU|nr:class I SAM-dependent methyltransferase [Solihabitans fulvus]KAA2252657.1 class I SAM-dependent methyltransferase [Solihabitans fulvus]
MTGARTVAAPQEYWERYYAEQFRFGLGTEDILAALVQVPPIHRWADLGCGSESLLWAIALRAERLVAVDADSQRLAILREFAAVERPRGIHRTALTLCGRTEPDAFVNRCRSLKATVVADCLTGAPLGDSILAATKVELVTQFGLLGLCSSEQHFLDCFAAVHQLLASDGWAAGANWVARDLAERVELTEPLYWQAAANAGISLLLLRRIPSADPEFPAVWTYLGRKRHP